MYTRSADKLPGLPGADGKGADGATSDLAKVGGSLSGILGKMGGGVSGFLGKAGGVLKMALPFLATGGPIAGPAIVGEAGPELYIPSSPGTIVPNHQLAAMASSSGGGQNITYSIDARGTDAVQVQQRVQSAIVAAHQSSVKAAVKQVHQQSARQPVRSR
jgi:phage-related minor tail protein